MVRPTQLSPCAARPAAASAATVLLLRDTPKDSKCDDAAPPSASRAGAMFPGGVTMRRMRSDAPRADRQTCG
jgi:hypothetical protein